MNALLMADRSFVMMGLFLQTGACLVYYSFLPTFITLSFPFTFLVPFTLHFSLPPYIVPSIPESFQLDYLSDTAVLLEWMPPKFPNGRLLRYVLGYQQGESVEVLGFFGGAL